MRALPLWLALASFTCAAHAQVGVEAGLLTAGSAATVDPLRQLGAALSRTVSGAAAAVPAGRAASVAPVAATASAAPLLTNTLTLSAAQPTGTRSFTPTLSGRYAAGVRWSVPGDTRVTLRAGGQEASGTTATALTVLFTAAAYSPCSVTVQALATPAQGVLTGELEVVRQPAPGEPPSKSLLTVAQRAARRGCQPSALPLLVNLAERRLRGVTPETDLDRLLAAALASTPAVTAADLQALVRDYDALPAATRTQTLTSGALALRTLADPTLTAVRGILASAASSSYKPTISALQPAPVGAAYPPGAMIQLLGRGFAPVPERNELYLGTDPANLLAQPPWPVVAASPTQLQFQLPPNLPDGQYYLLVMVDRRNMSAARALQVKRDAPTPSARAASVPPAHYRLRLLRLTCADETNPEWWGDDNVAVVLTAIADDRATTRVLGPLGGFADGIAQDVSGAEAVLLDGSGVAEGIGLLVELWQWQASPPPGSLALWALREAFGNALTVSPASFDNPKPQADTAGELSVLADLIGREQLVWPAADLARLLPPGQKLSTVVELSTSPDPQRSDATGGYRATLELQRLD